MLALVDADTLERFNEKWVPDPNSGCHLWMAGVDSSGYGNFSLKGKTLSSHRFSYSIHKCSVPLDLCVLHMCDVRCCVNPAHLFLGTIKDNMKDRDTKGRQARLKGSNNGNSKLMEEDVISICDLHDGRINTIYTLGNKFEVSPSTIHLILKGRNWGHLTKRGFSSPTKEGNCP